MWEMFYFHPTQAHNGYIEVYLELGWIGIAMLAVIIVTGCRNAVATFRWNPDVGRLRLAYITAALAYNMTEAGFRMMTLTWFFFLLSAVVVPKMNVQESSSESPSALARDSAPKLHEPQPLEAALDFAGRRLEAI